MDPELTRKFNEIQVDRRDGRVRAVRNFLITWGIIALVVIGSLTATYYHSATLASDLLALAIVLALFGGIFSLGIVSNIIDPLDSVDSAFSKFYEAIKFVEPMEASKESATTSKSSGDAASVQRHIYKLLKSGVGKLKDSEGNAPEILLEDANTILGNMINSLRKNLVPAARLGPVSSNTLESIARVLASPSLDGLKELTSEVQNSYKEVQVKGFSARAGLSKLRNTKLGQVMESLIYGYGIILVISLIYALTEGQDLATFYRNIAGYILGGGAALSVGLMSVLKR
jgi:hypothetical protein